MSATYSVGDRPPHTASFVVRASIELPTLDEARGVAESFVESFGGEVLIYRREVRPSKRAELVERIGGSQ